jgi:hypothetical protein
MKLLKWLGLSLGATLLGVLLLAAAARFGDGHHSGPFPGGALVAGQWAGAVPDDGSFATDACELDLQLEEPIGSRRTWLVVRDGVLYIPCGLPNPLKRWPHYAREDGRAVLRLDDTLYRVQLECVEDSKLLTAVAQISSRKYGFEVSPEADPDEIRFFALHPRRG